MRKRFYILGGLLLFPVVVVAALPLWLPWVLKPVGERLGLAFSEYERIGYSRFALEEVRYAGGGVTFAGDRVEGYLPLSWARRVLIGGGEGRDFLDLDGWRLEVELPDEPEEPEPDPEDPDEIYPYGIYGLVETIVPHVVRWAPRVAARDGRVRVDAVEIDIERVLWRGGQLEAAAAAEVGGERVELALTGDARDLSALSLEALLHPYGAGLDLVLGRSEGTLELRADATWEKNHLVLTAGFGPEDLLPREAALWSEAIEIPAERIALNDYDAVTGTLRANWREGRFDVDLQAAAAPPDVDSVHLPVNVDIRAEGDLESVRLESAVVRSPWLQATLSERLEVDYRGRLLSEESVFTVEGDLGEQRFFDAAGVFGARVGIAPGEAGMPDITFELNGSELAAFEVTGESLRGEGRVFWTAEAMEASEDPFPWPHADLQLGAENIAAFGRVVQTAAAEGFFEAPVFHLTGLEASLDDGTSVNGFVDFDLRERRVGRGEVALDVREDVVREFLPEGVGFDRARLAARISGPLATISHEVEFSLDGLRAPEVRPGDLSLAWRGDFLDFDEWNLAWRNDHGAAIEAAGAFHTAWPAERATLVLSSLLFSRGDESFLELESPARLEVAEAGDAPETDLALETWQVVLDHLVFEGADRRIALAGGLDWPENGRLSLEVAGFDPGFLEHYVLTDIPSLQVERLSFRAAWEETGPLVFRLENRVEMEVVEDERFQAALEVAGDGDGVRLERLEVRDRNSAVLTAEGLLPAVFYPGRLDALYEIGYDDEFFLAANSDPEAGLWARLRDLVGIELDAPQLDIDLAGTVARPRGEVRFLSDRVAYVGDGETDLPRVEAIEFRTAFDIDEARLERLRFLVEGQEVRAEGRLPIGEEAWGALIRGGTLPDWSVVEARLFVDEAELQPFARFAPGILSPQGRLSVDLEVRGDRFERGEIVLTGAATRPIMPLGSVQDLRARILFEGREAVLEEFSGRLGGERLRLSGRVEIPDDLVPEFDFSITGNNLPLTRQPGLVIRGDLDLRVRGGGEEIPSVTGNINMRESLVITELRAMAPVSVATPERRPPFFSVDQEPFSEWTLDIGIRGDQFLAVRAPGFRGRLSASLNVRGTLLEPQAIGQVRIDAGAIRFPFATMRIQQGTVTLSEDNPYRPQLFITATSRIFGYDLQMELSGMADDPVLEFTSHPPLSSEAILLMITAGELPRGELTFTGQQKATKLALYIAQNVFLEFGGDDDGAERLTIRSGENISEQGRETFYIEYMFWPRWGIVGEYDRFDAFNAGLKWRIFSR